jgi:hypothetical protein
LLSARTVSRYTDICIVSKLKKKIVRDEWDNKKGEIEKQLSDVLTVPWTVDVNPNQIYAYAIDGYGKESLGSCIAA